MNYIFDLDGTIGNTLPLCIAAFRSAIEPHIGKTLSDKEIIDSFGPSEEGTIKLLAPHAYEKALGSYLDWYRKLHVKYPNPFDGIVDILDYLRGEGLFIGMVTGKGPKSTLITLEQYGLSEHFEMIRTGSPDGPVKPDRIEEIVSTRNDPKSSYLYVGDSPSDVDACRSAGIKIVGVAWADTTDSNELKSKNPDYYFDAVADFSAFVRDKKGQQDAS